MSRKEIKELEVSKSWFELTKIFTVLAGLFLVVASLHASSYSHLKYDIDTPFKVCEQYLPKMDMSAYGNVTFQQCLNLIQTSIYDEYLMNQRWTYLLVGLGFLSILDALLFWIFGRMKLKKPVEKHDWILFVVFILINCLILSLFYYFIFHPEITYCSKLIELGNQTIDLCKQGDCYC